PALVITSIILSGSLCSLESGVSGRACTVTEDEPWSASVHASRGLSASSWLGIRLLPPPARWRSLANGRGDAFELASVSKRLRHVCTPILFRRCRVYTERLPETPPEIVQVQLCIWGEYVPAFDSPNYLSLLGYLPLLDSVVFRATPDGVPWFVVEQALQCSRVKSLTFTSSAQWMVPSRIESAYWIIDSIPPLTSPLRSVPLISLSYSDGVWRELRERPYHARLPHTARINDEYEAEARALAPLVLGMRTTAQSLRIPFDTSPVLEMCTDAWPHLTDLAFRGFYPESMPLSTMPTLLSRMPRLRNLSIEVAQPPCHSRAPIFGATAPPGCELLNIRSLTVAYPDPDDAIFSCIGPELASLSLRDWPRHYHFLDPRVRIRFIAPILSASEAFRILARMDTPHLRSLEIVYIADDARADDNLLHHIATAFPCLLQLVIHRYRPEGDERDTPYVSASDNIFSQTENIMH
ncbi:hypothetical protein C8Q77DRAFT_731403, partial [Trametes polyzona]